MKINSEKLWDYIFNLATDEKVKFKVYYDDCYLTEIYWDGENFNWEAGRFTSGAFFNPLYDFEVIEEYEPFKEGIETIDKWAEYVIRALRNDEDITNWQIKNYISVLMATQNQIIDKLNKLKGDKNV